MSTWLLCWLGMHDWRVYYLRHDRFYKLVCNRCGRRWKDGEP